MRRCVTLPGGTIACFSGITTKKERKEGTRKMEDKSKLLDFVPLDGDVGEWFNPRTCVKSWEPEKGVYDQSLYLTAKGHYVLHQDWGFRRIEKSEADLWLLKRGHHNDLPKNMLSRLEV